MEKSLQVSHELLIGVTAYHLREMADSSEESSNTTYFFQWVRFQGSINTLVVKTGSVAGYPHN